ncbi:MAG: caspase family protein [Deltaproteobacteria bacterium]|nr:MAG: caspase family protein [Deltaproteobacteria bacterium]
MTGTLKLLSKKENISSILLLFIAVFFIPCDTEAFLLKKPWADLEVDYLSELVSPDLTYFDGGWGGRMSCGPVSNYSEFSRFVFLNIEKGSGVFKRGIKGKNGYSFWTIKIKETGKVSLKGRYYWDGTDSIIFSGQIGVDPQDPGREILWFKGSRGKRLCEGKLGRKLPLAAMNALSDKIPLLAETLRQREEEQARRVVALEAEQRKREEEQAQRFAEQEAARKRQEQETSRFIELAAQEAERKWKEEQARRIAQEEAVRKRQEQAAKSLAKKKTPQDTTPPEIVIFSHDTSRAIKVVRNQKKVIIRGRATDKNGIVEVFVNKMEANLDEKGNFDIGILLGVGKNDIVVSAMDTYENRVTKTFSITREALAEPQKDQKPKTSSEQYYALVIGNDQYQYIRKLETAKRDARDVAKTLKQVYGFETKILLDATRNDIVQAINEIRKSLKEDDNLLIYYAGHGEFDKTANKAYWLPVDARSDDDTNWILADRITSNIRRISSKHILVVADSCYSGTFTRRAVTDLASAEVRDRYLKKMRAKKSRTLLASGGNEPVSDIGANCHSVFAAAVLQGLKGMEKDIFTAEELFYEHVKERVAGNADQTPEYNIIRNSGHDGGDFVFRRVKK